MPGLLPSSQTIALPDCRAPATHLLTCPLACSRIGLIGLALVLCVGSAELGHVLCIGPDGLALVLRMGFVELVCARCNKVF